MKHRTFIALALLVVAVVAGGYWFMMSQDAQSNEPRHLSGRIAKLSDGCTTGGTCSISLDNAKTIITACAVTPKDSHCKDYDPSKLRTGGQVEATVIKSPIGNYYNLDCDICTIKVE